VGHKIKEFRLSTTRLISLKPIHNSEMDVTGEHAPVHLGSAGQVSGAGG